MPGARVTRTYGVVLLMAASSDTILVSSMWLGWLCTLVVAELWIRHTRPRVVRRLADPAVLETHAGMAYT